VQARPVRRGRILVSLLLLLFGVGVLPLVGTSWQLVSENREGLQLSQKELQSGKARALSQQVSIYVRSLSGQVAAIARTLEVEAEGRPLAHRIARIREQGSLARFITEDESAPVSLTSISLVDATGSGARSGIALREPAIEQAEQEGVIRGLQGRAMISHPIMSSSLQEPVLVLAEPVSPGAGPRQGVVVVVATLGRLWQLTRELAQEGIFEVYVVDGRGRLVAHSDPARLEGDLDLGGLDIVRLFLASQGRTGATVPFTLGSGPEARRMLGTYMSIAPLGWGAIVQVEEKAAYYAADRMRARSYSLVAVAALLAAVLGTLLAGEISRPIHELARGARRLAGGDFSTRVEVRAQNEVGLLAEAFNQMGQEIEGAIEEIRQAAARNKELFMGSIRMLANAIDEKDPYTRGHSERVAFYSMLMARHLGMPPDEVERVHLSGLIHDVGKIGIEDKILRKPSALTEDEYEIMKQHPRKGEYILEAVPLLKSMAGAGLQHHENWDGSGYPDGLRGEAIPLLGRIVAVADAFDAMTTDRPYSKAMTFEAALARLRFLAGKKFDGKCVDGIEKAAACGDLTPAKARRVSVAARQAEAAPPPS
jgi:HD-GYP domain-containing protein (c-di-GMP phosphodiesterase class II)